MAVRGGGLSALHHDSNRWLVRRDVMGRGGGQLPYLHLPCEVRAEEHRGECVGRDDLLPQLQPPQHHLDSLASLFYKRMPSRVSNKQRKRLNPAPQLLQLRVVALLHPLEEGALRRIVHQPPPVRQHAPHHLAVVALRVAVHVLALRLAHRYASRPPHMFTEDDPVLLEHVNKPVEGRKVTRADRHVVLTAQVRHVAELDLL